MFTDNKNDPAQLSNPVFDLAVKCITKGSESLEQLLVLIADSNSSEKMDAFYQKFLEDKELQKQIAAEQALMQLLTQLRKFVALLERKIDSQIENIAEYLHGKHSNDCIKEIEGSIKAFFLNLYQRESDLSEIMLVDALEAYDKLAEGEVELLSKIQRNCEEADSDYVCYHLYQEKNNNLAIAVQKRISQLRTQLSEIRRLIGDKFSGVLNLLERRQKQNKMFALISRNLSEEGVEASNIAMLSIHDTDSSGQTLLHIATKAGNINAVKLLINLAEGFQINFNELLIRKDNKDLSALDNIIKNGDIEVLELVLLHIPHEDRHQLLRDFTRSLLISFQCAADSIENESYWPIAILNYSLKQVEKQSSLIILIGRLLDKDSLHKHFTEYARRNRERITEAFLSVQNQSIAKRMLEALFDKLLEYAEDRAPNLTLSDFIQYISNPFLGKELQQAVKKMVQYENRQPTKVTETDGRTFVNLAALKKYYWQSIESALTKGQAIIEEPFINKILAELAKALNVNSLPLEQVNAISKLCRSELKRISTLSTLESLPQWTFEARYRMFEEKLLQLLNACIEKFQYGDEDPGREDLIQQIVFKKYTDWLSGCADFEDAAIWLQSLGEYIEGFLIPGVKAPLSGNLHGILDEGKIDLDLNESLGRGFLSANSYNKEVGNLLHLMLRHEQYLENCLMQSDLSLLLLIISNTDLFVNHYHNEKAVLPIDYMCNERHIEDARYRSFIHSMLERMGWQLEVKLALWEPVDEEEIKRRECILNALRILRLNVLGILKEKLEDNNLATTRKIERLKDYVDCLVDFYRGIERKDEVWLSKQLAIFLKNAKKPLLRDPFLDGIADIVRGLGGVDSESATARLGENSSSLFPFSRTRSNSSVRSSSSENSSPPASPEKPSPLKK